MKEKEKVNRMTEEEKKAKFGDKYNPNYAKSNGKRNAKGEGKEQKPRQDPKFYILSENVAKPAASFSYPYLAGTKQYNVQTVSGEGSENTFEVVGTALAIDYVPYYGVSDTGESGINVASNSLFTWIRRGISGSRTYQASDVMIHVMFMTDVYTNILEAKRILQACQTYIDQNRSLPLTLLQALGVTDVATLQNNIANYRSQLNVYINKANSIAIPKMFKAFARKAIVAGTVLYDADSPRAQYYAMVKAGYFIYNPESTVGSSLLYHSWPTTGITDRFSLLLGTINEQLESMLTDDDSNTISGDILRAFKDTELYKLAELGEKDKLLLYTDENVLSQIENAKFLYDVFNDPTEIN